MIDEIREFAGEGAIDSDSDTAAKCIFFTHNFMHERREAIGGKTLWELIETNRKITKAQMIMDFLRKYTAFKKQK